MSREIPPVGARSIPHDFLAELDRAAHAPISGPGVSQTEYGTFILPPSGVEASLTAFELETSLTPGGTATAWSLAWDSATGDFTDPTYADPTDLTVTDVQNCHRSLGYDDVAAGEPGARGFCDGNGAIVSIQQRARRCTAALAANAAPAATVNVDTIVAMDGGQLPVANSTSATLSCTMLADASALDNAPCIIEWNETTDAWKIVWVQQRAKMISGTLGGALTTTTATQTVSSPVSMDGGQVPSGTVTGYNVYTTAGFEGDSGGRCVAAWNEATDHYEFIDVECPA